MEIIKRDMRLPIIKTKRLILRDITLEDISDDYISWLNNPDINKYLEIRFTPQTIGKVREYVKGKLNNTINTKHFGIYDQDGNRLLGTVTLPHINAYHSYADISFVIGHRNAQGKGYATEAVHGVTYYMFKECGLAKLWAGYYEDHEASAKVLKKNGFRVEGKLRKQYINHEGKRVDHVLVGLLAEEFKVDERLIGPLPLEK